MCMCLWMCAVCMCTLLVQVGSINKVYAESGLLSMGCAKQEGRNKHLSPLWARLHKLCKKHHKTLSLERVYITSCYLPKQTQTDSFPTFTVHIIMCLSVLVLWDLFTGIAASSNFFLTSTLLFLGPCEICTFLWGQTQVFSSRTVFLFLVKIANFFFFFS